MAMTVTLREWIRAGHAAAYASATTEPGEQRKARFLHAVRLALQITEAFRNVSGADFSAETVAVDEKEEELAKEGENGAVRSFTSARILADSGGTTTSSPFCGNEHGGEQGDLPSLGAVLYEFFAGIPPRDKQSCEDGPTTDQSTSDDPLVTKDDNGQQKKRERRIPNQKFHTPLRELGFPVSICSIVSNLMASDERSDCYHSASELEEDLRLMISEPDLFLFDVDVETATNKLDFPTKLYDRTQHISWLTAACERAISSSLVHEIILVSGYSGTGKSSLVQHVGEHLIEKGGYFISGKFGGMQQSPPLSAIVAAFNEYCELLLKGQAEYLEEMRVTINDALGPDAKVLMDIIPNLRKVIGSPNVIPVKVQGKQAYNRLKFLFRQFVRAISSTSQPIILFLDDLQWADKESLDLIQFLVADAENLSLILIGTYRSNEVDAGHPLKVQLQRIEEMGVTVTEVEVGNIGVDAVNSLISETLHLVPRLTQPLTNVVYCKTNGNALFVIQFLKSLQEEGLLHFPLELRRWKWDVDAIQSKNIADNVAELMIGKLRHLSQDLQLGLKVAACLGSQCEESVLELLGGGNSDSYMDLVNHLNVAVSDGLMVKAGTMYQFSHDQIQRAAYSLIGESEKEALHLQIGRMIWKDVSETEKENILFVIADQLNLGSKLITDHQEKISLAHLNLRAGEIAISGSAYCNASRYILCGVSLLDESDWEVHYELCLELFNLHVEVLYAIGVFFGINAFLKTIFDHARCVQDMLRAYYVEINMLGAQNKLADAINTAVDVLIMLGETFPDEIDHQVIMNDLFLTNDALEGTTIDGILQKDLMQDKDKLAIMQFHIILSTFAFIGKQELFPLVVFRMVRLSLSHGVCSESAVAFADYGMILCTYGGDIRGGYRFGKVALSLLERLGNRLCFAQVYLVVYGMINKWVEPLQAGLEAHIKGYEVGMLSGDIRHAMANTHFYIANAIHSGCKLELFAEKSMVFFEQMKVYNQHNFLSVALPWRQVLNELIDDSKGPAALVSEAMEQEGLVVRALDTGNWAAVCAFYFSRMWLAIFFGKHELAAKMAEKHQRASKIHVSAGRGLRGAIDIETFYMGLIGITLARTKGELKWKPIAKDAIAKHKNWAKNSSWNFSHKLALLNAEWAFFMGDYEKAAIAYDLSINTAGKHGFIHEQAMACERAAIFSSELGNNITAAEYLTRSRDLYIQWGARRKANDVIEQLAHNRVSHHN